MPDAQGSDASRPDRSAADRAADHAGIDRLADELLPALIAKLGATGLGELEVREGDWRVRLRRPATGHAVATAARDRRRDRTEHRDGADRGHERGGRGTTGQGDEGARARDATRSVATSPAVGIYRPRTDLAAGSRIRAGDRLGAVEMLGIPQEVIAPIDGIVGTSLAGSGDAVEYGQDLLVIEFTPASGTSEASTNGHDRGALDVP